MKKISLYISTLVLLVFAIGCEEDDKFIDITQSIVAPSNLDVLYNITQDNTGNVTITPSAEAAHMFDVDFGDNSEIAAGLKPGSGVTHQYAEGTYQVGLTAKGLNNLTASASFPLEVSFRAPENLVVTTTINQANPLEVSVEANADYAAYYHVFFGEDPDADPVQINAGELATHTYASVGTYTLRVVALSGGTATTEHTEEVVISAPTSLPIDFEIFDTTVFFDFGGTSHAIVANPDQSGINTSATVAKVVKGAGEVWAGNVIITTEPIDFSSKTTMKLKVWSPRAGVNVLMKLENIDDDSVFKEVSAVTTSANSWETLSYDFSALDTSNTYQKIVFFFDIGTVGDGSADWTFYIDDIDHMVPNLSANPLVGSWKLAPEAGSLAVGPNPNDFSWWSSGAAEVTTRACLFDDEYVFNADGSFQNVMGAETWLEGWQPGQTGESCGAPIAPHDGSNAATWSSTNNTITISGDGAFLGLAKVHNAGEDGNPANDTITYNYSLSDNDNTLVVTIQGFNAGVPEATWRFTFIKN